MASAPEFVLGQILVADDQIRIGVDMDDGRELLHFEALRVEASDLFLIGKDRVQVELAGRDDGDGWHDARSPPGAVWRPRHARRGTGKGPPARSARLGMIIPPRGRKSKYDDDLASGKQVYSSSRPCPKRSIGPQAGNRAVEPSRLEKDRGLIDQSRVRAHSVFSWRVRALKPSETS